MNELEKVCMPVYLPPLIPFQSELYKLLSDPDEVDFVVYDSSITAEDIYLKYRDMDSVKFGVIADLSCSQTHAKADAIIWQMTTRIELFSNYRGRLRIAEMIQAIGNAVTRTEQAFSSNLAEKGYAVVRLDVGEAVIGSALYDGALTWQNGYITLHYWLSQLD